MPHRKPFARTAFGNPCRKTRYEGNQRHGRNFHDVYGASGEPRAKHVRHSGRFDRNVRAERSADAFGALLCAVHRSVHGDIQKIQPQGLQARQGIDHRHQHLSFRALVGNEDYSDFQSRKQKNQTVRGKERRALPRGARTDSGVRRVQTAGLYALRFVGALFVLFFLQVEFRRRGIYGHGDNQRAGGGVLYVHVQVLQPYSESGRAVPQASIGLCICRKDIHRLRHRAFRQGRARRRGA